MSQTKIFLDMVKRPVDSKAAKVKVFDALELVFTHKEFAVRADELYQLYRSVCEEEPRGFFPMLSQLWFEAGIQPHEDRKTGVAYLYGICPKAWLHKYPGLIAA
jgi:hypothetical protein